MEASVISVAAQLNLVDVACRKRAQHAPEASLPISSGWTPLSKFISPCDRPTNPGSSSLSARDYYSQSVDIGRKVIKKNRDEHPDQIIWCH